MSDSNQSQSMREKSELQDLLNPDLHSSNYNMDLHINPFASVSGTSQQGANDGASIQGLVGSRDPSMFRGAASSMAEGGSSMQRQESVSSGYSQERLDDASTNNPLATNYSGEQDESSVAPVKSVERLSLADTTASLNTGGNAAKDRADSLSSTRVLHQNYNQRPAGYSDEHEDFTISVCDPTTKGEGMKAHTTYKVVAMTKSTSFKNQHMSVNRRYKEFLWLSAQLSARNPGIIVPPPPEKHAIGRFDEDFVENRRALLDRMMKKIAAHPVLNKDPVFVTFMETDDLSSEISDNKKKEQKSGSSFMSKLGDAMSNATGSFAKVTDPDEFFEGKRVYIEEQENLMKAVAKAIDQMIQERDNLSVAVLEFGESVFALGTSELNNSIEKQLTAFGEAHKEIQKIHSEQSGYDLMFLANTFDEYVRTMGAVKSAFQSRLKIYNNHLLSQQNLSKLKISLEKTKMSRSKPEKVQQAEQEIAEAEQKIIDTKKEFDDVSVVLKKELELFEHNKVKDLQLAVREFLGKLTESHEKMMSVWDSFLKNNASSSVHINGINGN
ncbi:hypothetical protein MP228_005214 [Amoeboaphelidium protococcarum]|nr:hypothetical protein MP228_005214 [Amoeboaphelidium protococcarum]